MKDAGRAQTKRLTGTAQSPKMSFSPFTYTSNKGLAIALVFDKHTEDRPGALRTKGLTNCARTGLSCAIMLPLGYVRALFALLKNPHQEMV